MASAWKLPLCPHTSMTGINMAASLHFLTATENAGYFEGDVSLSNAFRDRLVAMPYRIDTDGSAVLAATGAGIGVEVDEGFLAAHPLMQGRNYA
jgi:L-alanine-DL-glutamate epimerase-like enolase superfamily enzyme